MYKFKFSQFTTNFCKFAGQSKIDSRNVVKQTQATNKADQAPAQSPAMKQAEKKDDDDGMIFSVYLLL